MKIQTKQISASPEGVIPANSIIDLPEAIAKEWVKDGCATWVDQPQEEQTQPIECTASFEVSKRKRVKANA